MQPVTFDLNPQVAPVTGASRGMGHDLAPALAAAGAGVGTNHDALDATEGE